MWIWIWWELLWIWELFEFVVTPGTVKGAQQLWQFVCLSRSTIHWQLTPTPLTWLSQATAKAERTQTHTQKHTPTGGINGQRLCCAAFAPSYPLWQQTIAISGRGLRARVACLARCRRLVILASTPIIFFAKIIQHNIKHKHTHTERFWMRDVFAWLNWIVLEGKTHETPPLFFFTRHTLVDLLTNCRKAQLGTDVWISFMYPSTLARTVAHWNSEALRRKGHCWCCHRNHPSLRSEWNRFSLPFYACAAVRPEFP